MKNIEFINAGAGSGKTYTLTNILAKNIIDGKCSADEVILTTFTENVASELMAKSRETLLKNNMHSQANLLSSAAIGTVHSVAFKLIKKYWYHLGTSVEMNVMTLEDVDFYISQALANVPDNDELMQLREIAVQLSFKDYMSTSINYDRWKLHLKTILEHATVNRMDKLDSSKNASLSEARQIFPIQTVNLDENALKNVFKQLILIINNDKDNETTKRRKSNLEKILTKSNWNIPEFIEAQSILNDTTNSHKATLPEIDSHLAILNNIYASEKFVNYILNYIELVFNLAQRSMDAFKEYKKKNRLIDFNDMESMLLDLLETEEVQQEIKSSFKQVYVDEFQDSSPIQFEIFNRLSELVEQSYWVGDPKQAIYGFRGTNPELISAVIDKFMQGSNGLTIGNLDKSWRSRPGIVNLCNEIFIPALLGQVKEEKFIRLHPIRYDNELPLNEKHAPVRHWHSKDDMKGGGNIDLKWHHLAESVRDFLKEGIVVTQKNLCKYHNPEERKSNVVITGKLKPKDIAILCKENDTVSKIAENLRGFGLKVSGKQKGIKETAEMQLLIAAINYLIDPADQLARSILLLLGGTFDSAKELIDSRLGYIYSENAPEMPGYDKENDEEEKKKQYSDWKEYLGNWSSDSEILNKINKLQTNIAVYSIPLIVEKLVIEGGLYDLVQLWDNPSQRMANLQTFIQTAQAYDERCLTLNISPSPTGFINYVENLGEKNFMQSAASGDDAINILTYHTAKGLEWPVVILTELDKFRADEESVANKSFFNVTNENPEHIDPEKPFDGKLIKLIPWPFGSKKNIPMEEINNRIKETPRFEKELLKERNEASRLLYVGFTRARDILITTSYRTKEKPLWLEHVCGPISLMKDIDEKQQGMYKLPFFNRGGDIPVKVNVFDTEMGFPEQEVTKVPIHEKAMSKGKGKLKYVSPSNLEKLENTIVSELHDFNMHIETGSISSEQEAELGNCLHDIYASYRMDMDDKAFTEMISGTIRNHNLHANLTHPEHILNAIKNLFLFMDKTYGKALKIYKEIPLQMEENGQIFRGDADLLWETEKELVLVDYKSYPGGRNHLLRSDDVHFAGNYSGQLHKYKEMIEAGHPEKKKVTEMLLYYSVIGIIVKVII